MLVHRSSRKIERLTRVLIETDFVFVADFKCRNVLNFGGFLIEFIFPDFLLKKST
jgi:hypothetical protein